MIINLNFGDNFDFHREILELFKIGFSVFLTGFIGWKAYLLQQQNERLKQDLSNFTLIFCSVQNNINYASTFLQKAQCCIEELSKNISILKKLKKHANEIHPLLFEQCLDGKEISKLQEYQNSAKSLCEKLIFETSYIKIIGNFSENNYEKEALFLTNYGDTNFQIIYTNLVKEYVKNNLILNFINEIIDRTTNKTTIRSEKINICDISQKGYEALINNKIQECLLLLDLYKQLKNALESVIFYSDLAFNHLLNYNSKSYNKYKNTYKSLGLLNFELKINKNYNIKDLMYYNKNKDTYERLNKMPEFKTFELNFFEKLSHEFF